MKRLLSALSAFVLCQAASPAADDAGSAPPALRWETKLPLEKVVLTGEIRQRLELQDNYDLDGPTADDEDFVASRIRFGIEVVASKDWNGFIQVQDARNWGGSPSASTGNTQATQSDSTDIQQGYVRGKPYEQVTFTAGRQAWSFGQEKLIGSGGWANTGRAFDGLRLVHARDAVEMNLLLSKVANAPSADERDINFGGVYATVKAIEEWPFDLYWLELRDERKSRGEIAAKRAEKTDIHTVGFQMSRKEIVAGPGMLDGGVETDWQSGQRGSDSLSASAHHARAGYTWSDADWKPRIGAEVDLASGDGDPADGDEGTFDQLFPTGHRFHGITDRIGRRNLFARMLVASVQPREKWRVRVEYHLFRLENAHDSPYAASGSILRTNTLAAAGGAPKDLGDEVDLVVNYQHNAWWGLEGGVGYFDSGRYFTEVRSAAGAGQGPAVFSYLQSTFKF